MGTLKVSVILMPDIKEAKCFKFTDQIPPPPRSSHGGETYIYIQTYASPRLVKMYKKK